MLELGSFHTGGSSTKSWHFSVDPSSFSSSIPWLYVISKLISRIIHTHYHSAHSLLSLLPPFWALLSSADAFTILFLLFFISSSDTPFSFSFAVEEWEEVKEEEEEEEEENRQKDGCPLADQLLSESAGECLVVQQFWLFASVHIAMWWKCSIAQLPNFSLPSSLHTHTHTHQSRSFQLQPINHALIILLASCRFGAHTDQALLVKICCSLSLYTTLFSSLINLQTFSLSLSLSFSLFD